jgi:hypothetical protein
MGQFICDETDVQNFLINFLWAITCIKCLSDDDRQKKLLTISKKNVEESGGKWIIISYFSIFIGKKRVWPHL